MTTVDERFSRLNAILADIAVENAEPPVKLDPDVPCAPSDTAERLVEWLNSFVLAEQQFNLLHGHNSVEWDYVAGRVRQASLVLEPCDAKDRHVTVSVDARIASDVKVLVTFNDFEVPGR